MDDWPGHEQGQGGYLLVCSYLLAQTSWQSLHSPVVSISDILEANGLMNILLVILGWPVLYSSSFSVAHCDPYMYTVGAKSIPRLRECQNWTKLEPLSNLMISVCRWGTWGAEQGSNLSEVTTLTEVGWLCSNSMSPAFYFLKFPKLGVSRKQQYTNYR